MISITIQIPDDARAARGVDTRTTFRRSMENRMRPRMNALRDRVRQVSRYEAIAKDFAVVQRTTENTITFALVNNNPKSRYLLASEGTQPHTITQRPHMVPLGQLVKWSGGDMWLARVAQAAIARRGVVIPHPGTEPDTAVFYEIDMAERGLLDAAVDGADAWARRFGSVEA